jgi:hypothetical protein
LRKTKVELREAVRHVEAPQAAFCYLRGAAQGKNSMSVALTRQNMLN